MTRTTREVAEQTATALATVPDLTRSPFVIDATSTPAQLTGKSRWYSLDLQSANTKLLRDTHAVEVAHTCTVRVLCKVNPNQQWNDYLDILDFEDMVTDAMANPAKSPGVRWKWERTSRRQTPSKEYLYLEMVHTLTVDRDLGQATTDHAAR